MKIHKISAWVDDNFEEAPDLQQRTARATVTDLVRSMIVLRGLLKSVEDGEGLTFHPLKDHCLEARSLQGYLLFAAQTGDFAG